MLLDLNHVIDVFHKEKGITKERIIEILEEAMLTAARKKMGFYADLEAQFNQDLGEVELFQFKEVVEDKDFVDDEIEVKLSEAHKEDPDAQLGDSLGIKIDTSDLGRIAAQQAKQILNQRMRDAERDVIYTEYQDKVGHVLTGVVRRYEKNNLIIDLGKSQAVIFRRDQIEGENYKTGDRVQALLMEIDPRSRGGQILIMSRKHPQFVKALFEMEVPEIAEGIVEIKSVARDAGVRTKIAVYSADGDVDPVGACVGMKGSRVQSVVQELRGEKIDIVLWDQDPARFVCNAIAPAQVSKVIILDNRNSMEIVVPDDQLSLAIGRKGQNVRLAAQLTGWNIDVCSETKSEEISQFAKAKLVQDLGLSDSIAMILHSHAFRSSDEIAETPLEEFLDIPGMNKESLEEIHRKAKEVVAIRRAEEAKNSDQTEEVDEMTEAASSDAEGERSAG